MYSVYYSESEVESMKASLKTDCAELGVRQYAELVGLEEYWTSF